MKAIDFLKAQQEYKDEPITNETSMFYYVAPAKVADLMQRYSDFIIKDSTTCQHYKRQYIPELNKDLCLICATLIK